MSVTTWKFVKQGELPTTRRCGSSALSSVYMSTSHDRWPELTARSTPQFSLTIVQMTIDGWFQSRSTIPRSVSRARRLAASVSSCQLGSSVQIRIPARSAAS
jgi:hypothetical protein